MTEQCDDYDPWDCTPIRWDTPIPLCLCGHMRHAHNLDRVKEPCTVSACGCLSWRPSGRGEQRGHLSRQVLL